MKKSSEKALELFNTYPSTSIEPSDKEAPVDSKKAKSIEKSVNRALKEELNRSSDMDIWYGSEFFWIKQIPTHKRSAAGVLLAQMMFQGLGYTPLPRAQTGHDLVVNNIKVKVKFSTLWATGLYTFQHITTKGYDCILFIGIHPEGLNLWLVGKNELRNKKLKTEGELGLLLDPNNTPEWMGSNGSVESFFKDAPKIFGEPGEPYGPASYKAV